MASKHAELDAFIAKLEDVIALTNDEIVAIRSLPRKVEALRKGTTIVHQGDQPTKSCAILEGTTCMFKDSAEGFRQILLVHYPGDIPDLQSLHLNEMDAGLATLAPSVLAFFEHQDIRDLTRRFPRIGDALWRATLVDASILREWLFNLGQRDARQRLALFLCETVVRATNAGLSRDGTVPLTMTQVEMSLTLGLSSIHINRMMQDLRRNELVSLQKNKLCVPDFGALAAAARFDPTYLHLTRAQLSKLAAAGIRKVSTD